MQVLLVLLIVSTLGYLIYRSYSRPRQATSDSSTKRSKRCFAFISNGLVFYRESGEEMKQLESSYVQEATDRQERSRERHSWKQGTSFGISAQGNVRDFDANHAQLSATSVAFEANGDMLYFLKDQVIGGLFRREATTGKEFRLLLKQNLRLSDLSVSREGTLIAASSQHSDGVANIVIFDRDGNKYREVTGGDTVDTAPAWIPGWPNRLLFQSSGLARDDRGYIVAQGHTSIQMLDMESGHVSPIIENPRFDYIKPRVCPAGNLHFIRRPYEAPRYGIAALITDTMLFPFRLLRAVFHFLNFFSMMYSRKPLTTATGTPIQADLKNILLQGRRIDAEKASRSERPVHGVPSLVTGNWELVSRTPDGTERILATNVASYDISSDGTIIYSNGYGVFVLEHDGSTGLALDEGLITEVFAAQS